MMMVVDDHMMVTASKHTGSTHTVCVFVFVFVTAAAGIQYDCL